MCWIHLEDLLAKTVELDDTSWKLLEDIFLRRLEDFWKLFLQDVLKTSWNRVEEVLRTSQKCLEYVLKTYGLDEYIGLDQDVLKTSSEDVWLRRICSSWLRHLEDVLRTSSEDEDERRLEDVFIKTNVWWDTVSFVKLLFGCPTANFGLLSRGQSHSVDVNHCVFTFSTWRSLRISQRNCIHNPGQASSGIWTGYHPILITKC